MIILDNFITLLGSDENNDLYNATLKDSLNRRILILNEEVTDDLVESVIYQILRWNMEDISIPNENRKPIRILFNSIGGDAYMALSLIDIITQSDTPIYGISVGFVASAAYNIFLACHKRYAFKNGVFLMHDGSLTISNSTRKAQQTMQFFEDMDKRYKEHVLKRTTMSEEMYDEFYDQEFYMYADSDAKKYGVVDMIIGEDIDFKYVFF